MEIKAKIKSVCTLLMHNGALVDDQSEIVKEIKKLTAKKPRTDADKAEIDRLSYLGAFYLDDKGDIVLPNVNIHAVICAGARKTKRGKDAQAGVFVEGHGTFEFEFKGKKTPQALWDSGKFVDRRPVKVNMAKVMRVRPKFDKWASQFTLEVDEEICNNPEEVKTWLETGGKRAGLGDFRPMFGRFEVVEFKKVKGK